MLVYECEVFCFWQYTNSIIISLKMEQSSAMICDPEGLCIMNSARHLQPWFKNSHLFHARLFLDIFELQNKHNCISCTMSCIWKGLICSEWCTRWMQIREWKESYFQKRFSKCWLQSNGTALSIFSPVMDLSPFSNILMSQYVSHVKWDSWKNWTRNQYRKVFDLDYLIRERNP
jgi:hypothetical protein